MMSPRPPWPWVLTAVAAVGIAVLAADGGPLTLGYGVPILALLLFWLWVLPEFAAWRVARRDPTSEHVTGNATSEGLQVISRFGTLQFPWRSFTRCIRTDSLVLVVQPPGIAQIFAREFFASADDFARFGNWAEAGVPARRSRTIRPPG